MDTAAESMDLTIESCGIRFFPVESPILIPYMSRINRMDQPDEGAVQGF